MPEGVLALGSNLGDRLANLQAALHLLAERDVPTTHRSRVYETDPVPGDQPRFLNAVVVVETSLNPADLLTTAKEVERLLGRVPGPRWGPRPIDIDILFYGDESLELPDLVIPHPRIAERSFVLVPLADVLSGPLPLLCETAADLLARLDDSSPPVPYASLAPA